MENLINFKLFFSKLEKISCKVWDCLELGLQMNSMMTFIIISYQYLIFPESLSPAGDVIHVKFGLMPDYS